MLVRLRIPELLTEKKTNAHRVAAESDGRINERTLYRLKRVSGRVRYFDAQLCEALCDVLDITPAELFESEPTRKAG